MSRSETRTGGRDATRGVIPGDICLSVGKPALPEPDGFAWTPLSDVARLESGHTPARSKPEYWDGDIPWLGIRDATGNHGRRLMGTEQHVTQLGIDNSSARVLPAETVCLSRTASVGFVVTMGVPMATSQDFVNWVCGPTLNPRYLHFALLLEQKAVRERFAHGSTHQTMYYPEAKALHLLMPPRVAQDAIAEVLAALHDKIAANVSLERTADDLMAAHAERAGLAVMENVGFLAAVDVTFGAAFKGAFFAPPAEGRPLIRIRDLKTHAPQTWTTEERRDETVILPGDVVVGMDADFEPAWWLGEPALLNQRVMRVSCDAWGSALTRYLVTPPLRQIQSSKTGTTVAHLNKSDLATLELPKLPQENVAAVREIVDPLLARRVASAKERARLGSLRDVLLPELMSGRLRVKDAEKTVEGVV